MMADCALEPISVTAASVYLLKCRLAKQKIKVAIKYNLNLKNPNLFQMKFSEQPLVLKD